MSRLAERFARLRRERRTGLVAYVTAGDPDLDRSAGVMRAVVAGGADVLEVGVPFSDPMADGPSIQRATERAIAAGTTLPGVFDLLDRERSSLDVPIVLFTYFNPVLRMGEEAFVTRCRDAEVDGVLVLDLPPEEGAGFRSGLLGAGLDPIFLLSPTTTDARLEAAAREGRGFLYLISRLGVTGARTTVDGAAPALARRVRALTDLPLAVGFGLSHPDHIRTVSEWADAAVVGSALVDVIGRAANSSSLESEVEAYVHWLRGENRAAIVG